MSNPVSVIVTPRPGFSVTAAQRGPAGAEGPPGENGIQYPVPVTRDWSDATDAWLDVAAATGLALGRNNGELPGMPLYFLLAKEGSYWCLKAQKDFGNDTGEWSSLNPAYGDIYPEIGEIISVLGVWTEY